MDNQHAALAFDMFCYQTRKSIGALVAALGGLDTLVFTGGIGENAPVVREGICSGLDCFGIRLDGALNNEAREVISAMDSRCAVRIVRTDEEIVIARHTRRVLATDL